MLSRPIISLGANLDGSLAALVTDHHRKSGQGIDEIEGVEGLRLPERQSTAEENRMTRFVTTLDPYKKVETVLVAAESMAEAWDPDDGRYEGLGHWMAAALDDPSVCAEMKADITRMFETFDAYRAAITEAEGSDA